LSLRLNECKPQHEFCTGDKKAQRKISAHGWPAGRTSVRLYEGRCLVYLTGR